MGGGGDLGTRAEDAQEDQGTWECGKSGRLFLGCGGVGWFGVRRTAESSPLPSHTRHPTPDTRHPTPNTQHPTPHTRHPTP
ncbi:MAG: hypothetical protein F6J93_23805 [Oscillatoria sp. SIO1A7]|nr:hypothetical protein [Oscillatoria sp. SIO1A7]